MKRWRTFRRALGAIVLLALLALLAVQGWYLSRVIHYADHVPETTAFMQLGAPNRDDLTVREHWVDYEAMSPWIKRAVIAAEDARFMQHDGFDWRALRKALRENLEADRIVRGGSTISQQLAKNLFLSPDQTYMRKGQEAMITIMLESALSKRRILELYLNVIEWGHGIFGVEAAAQHYYGVSADSLSRWQAAMLAARIPRPNYYDRRGVTTFLLERASDIYNWSNMVPIPE